MISLIFSFALMSQQDDGKNWRTKYASYSYEVINAQEIRSYFGFDEWEGCVMERIYNGTDNTFKTWFDFSKIQLTST
jgi:hypothetical protein